jgi:hypothetical protein
MRRTTPAPASAFRVPSARVETAVISCILCVLLEFHDHLEAMIIKRQDDRKRVPCDRRRMSIGIADQNESSPKQRVTVSFLHPHLFQNLQRRGMQRL